MALNSTHASPPLFTPCIPQTWGLVHGGDIVVDRLIFQTSRPNDNQKVASGGTEQVSREERPLSLGDMWLET